MIALDAAVTPVGVGEREYRVAVYRPAVRPGRVRFNVRNLGEDTHDFVVRRAGRRVGGIAELRAGRSAALTLTLRRPGRYELVCTLADHERLGMRAVLRVSTRAPR